MDFLDEPAVFWTIVALAILLGCFLLYQVIKYWHNVKWIRWPIAIIASAAVGFSLRGYYDERFGEPCPPFVDAPAPIVPPLGEPSRLPEPNSEESLEQTEPPQ